jgi:hypothetical protein
MKHTVKGGKVSVNIAVYTPANIYVITFRQQGLKF